MFGLQDALLDFLPHTIWWIYGWGGLRDLSQRILHQLPCDVDDHEQFEHRSYGSLYHSLIRLFQGHSHDGKQREAPCSV